MKFFIKKQRVKIFIIIMLLFKQKMINIGENVK